MGTHGWRGGEVRPHGWMGGEEGHAQVSLLARRYEKAAFPINRWNRPPATDHLTKEIAHDGPV